MVGVVGLIPPAVLVATGLAGLKNPRLLTHPLLVLGGLAVAIVASLVAVTHWEVARDRDHLRLCCTIRKRPADLAVLAAGLALLGIITGYSFVENFEPR